MNTGYEPMGKRIGSETLHLKQLREKAGLSQEELAGKSRVSREQIEEYEQGRQYPGVEQTELLAAALGVTYEQLMGLDLTGYPSIDQPWRQYYCREAYTTPLPEGSIYELVYERNKDRLKEPAIEYMKTKVTYGQLFDYIEKARNSFLRLGVRPGEVVTMALPNIPENVYCIYALNRIGAIANMVDLRLAGPKLIDKINSVHSRIVVCSDVFAEHTAAIQDQVQVDHWIVLSPFDSTPQLIRGFLKWKNKMPAVKEIRSRLEWKDFLKIGMGTEGADVPVKPNDTACIFHTSGTTSLPKAVQMTNRNMNAMSFCYEYAPIETRAGDRFLSHVPPFLAYNTIFTIHMPLTLRMTVVMVPLAPMERFVELLVEKKPNHVGGSSAFWREFTRIPGTRGRDFSHLRGMACGNDVMDPVAKKLANEILAEGGCEYKILEGYGMTEAGSAAVSCWPNIYPEDSSIGIPLCCNVVSIFDPEDPDRELTYGERGEICIQGPTVMPGYFGDPETTARVLKQHKDGSLWLHSGDLGYMKENGCIYFMGRLKRTIVTYNGYKIAPRELEEMLLQLDNVTDCCVVGHPDTENGAGQVPAAFLVLKDPSQNTAEEAGRYIEAHTQADYPVKEYRILEQLPMTPNGKVDYRKLEEWDSTGGRE